jgi:hypothetical protein
MPRSVYEDKYSYSYFDMAIFAMMPKGTMRHPPAKITCELHDRSNGELQD